MDTARQLEHSFVTQDDAAMIATMFWDVKMQFRAVNEALELDLEPPTRAAGLVMPRRSNDTDAEIRIGGQERGAPS
jgi:hypothetical protein